MMKSFSFLGVLWPFIAYFVLFETASGQQSSIRECLRNALDRKTSLVAFKGDLFYQFTAVKPYNLDIPITPAAVTFPKTKEQVSAIVKCAAAGGYKVQARSGGHSYGNYGLGGTDGAIVVDLKNFQQFSMDRSTWEATVGGGTRLGDLDERLLAAGQRAIAHGTCLQVGVGGHATIGGLGPTSREWGMTLDHIREAEAVLANGTIITASETQNSDAFFALRGAGASFGIITQFKFRTQAAPGMAVRYRYTFALGSTASRANLFKEWQTFISDPGLSRKFSTLLTIIKGSIIVSGTFYGTREEYDAFEIEHRFPGFTQSSVIVFTDFLGLVANLAEDLVLGLVNDIPAYFYAKSLSFTNQTLIPSSGIDRLFEYLDTERSGSLIWIIFCDLEAGFINDIPKNATAYAHRDALYWIQSYAVSLGPVSQTTKNFLQGINNIIEGSLPGSAFGVYPGYVDPPLVGAREAYWGSNLPRLQRIKADIDPNDVFHNPQSVQPASD